MLDVTCDADVDAVSALLLRAWFQQALLDHFLEAEPDGTFAECIVTTIMNGIG